MAGNGSASSKHRTGVGRDALRRKLAPQLEAAPSNEHAWDKVHTVSCDWPYGQTRSLQSGPVYIAPWFGVFGALKQMHRSFGSHQPWPLQ